ncbi:MAG: lipopolysaccharide heptosyltransferase I [Casimicrobiaceae bacterium]
MPSANDDVLVVRPSSLGDIVYALAIVSDILTHDPQAHVDWVAEEAFASLVRLDPRIRTVIPLGLRRWRQAPLRRDTWHDLFSFRRALREVRYAAIIDLQEQVKGALVARSAQGIRHGFDRNSIREPVATWLHDVHHRIDRQQHFLDKCRALAAAALDYRISGPARWQFVPPAATAAMPAGRYALVFHATSRADKLWPEDAWRGLLTRLATAGITTLLPWGTAVEEARSHRLAAGAAAAIVPARQALPDLAALIRHADIVVGVDTGLTHLAAAMGTSTVAVFTTTDPSLAGVARLGAHARDVGGHGSVPPQEEVLAAVGRLLQRKPQC